MGTDEDIKPVYNEFKKYVNTSIGKELEKTNNDGDAEIPPQPMPVVD